MELERWDVGAISVTRVLETVLDHERAVDVLPCSDEELAAHRDWMGPYLGPGGEMLMSVHAFCVEVAGRKIVVDTCIGNGRDYGDSPYLQIFNGLETDLLDRMAAAGFGRDDVDVVVCTHLHPDHVGWNTMRVGGRWVPTFPNARYVLSRTDSEVWRDLDGPHNPWAVAVQPVEDAGLLDEVDAPCEIVPGLSLIPTPGHTAGHVSVLLESNGERAVITGDMVHSPVQLVEPSWTYRHDADRAQAEQTARQLVDMVVDGDVLVLGTHFCTPTVGRLQRHSGAVTWHPA